MPRGAKPTKVSDLEKRLAESLEREKATGELLQEKNRALTEALEQQTATSEILRVISSSPTDLQPVFDALLKSAVTLCAARDASLYQVDGGVLRHVSAAGAMLGAVPVGGALAISPKFPSGQAVLERRTIHIHDTWSVLDTLSPDVAATIMRDGVRSTLSVPLLRGSEAIGVIMIRRKEVGPFADKHIRLLETFADQAVIAIENVRLFTELQEKNEALTQAHAHVSEALEQQTATSEILRVISRSQTDVQPVFRAIVASAARLCGARFTALYRYDGELVHVAAHHGLTPEVLAVLDRLYPMRPARDQASGRVILTGAIVHIPEVLADPEYRHEVAIAGAGKPPLRGAA